MSACQPLDAPHEGAANVSGEHSRVSSAPRRGNLLFVDADDFLLEMISSAFALSRPRWGVIAVQTPAEALAVLAEHAELDAIVTEVSFERSIDAGRAFIQELTSRWPDIPVLALTTVDRDELRGVDTAEFIAKPPDVDFLISRIDRIIRRQRESQVRGISLTTFLQILEIDRKSCTLYVSAGGRVGELCFRDGRLLRARLAALEGKDALFAMLSMNEHTLRVVDSCAVESGTAMSLASLLMEWSVRADHTKRDAATSREEK
ncbi:MAG TPA: DUF4388 domain-containing protein [Thermoanaerobaculia bacterium]|nr:DUF4388 domain-containing protein [Thermoanaerobaculia bacterium]